MPLKVKNKVEVQKSLRKVVPDARSRFAKQMKAEIVEIITDKVKTGVSPVKGQNRYQKYSKQYADQRNRGRRQPVTLSDTGEMLKSLKAVLRRSGRSVLLRFEGARNRKLSKIHQFGDYNGGKTRARKILPIRSGENFKQEILNKIFKAAQKAVDEAAKRL